VNAGLGGWEGAGRAEEVINYHPVAVCLHLEVAASIIFNYFLHGFKSRASPEWV
jgi:hypothetical protein